MTDEQTKQTRQRDVRDTILGGCVLLGMLALIGYEIRSTYEDFRLLDRGTASFAYVTRARGEWASKTGSRSDRCELEAMLPRETQARAPVALPDMSDARYFTSYEPDSDRQCAEYLHTWQPVLFDPRNPSRARFRGGLESSIFQFFVWAALFGVIAIGLAIFRAIRRWLARRSAT